MLKNGIEFLQSKLADLPKTPGVYRMVDEQNKILYVGKAKNLKNRVTSYTKTKQLSNRIKQMVSETTKLEIVKTDTEIEALILELNFIKTLKPKYNILYNDDKTFPYIYFNHKHEFPGMFKFRGMQRPEGKFFGPYSSGYDLNKTLDLLKKSFLLRSCSDAEFARRKTPCLEYQIKRCSAPCVNKISQKDYRALLKESFKFLKGRTKEIRDELASKMDVASTKQDYERAAEFRDRIKALNSISAKQEIAATQISNADILVIISQKNKVLIEMFLFRNGFNHGNQQFFPKNFKDLSEAEILTNFIKQFYGPDNLPAEIITNIAVSDAKNLSKAYLKHYQKKVNFLVPKNGKKLELLNFVKKNAKYHFAEKIAKLETNLTYHQKLQDIFQLKKTPNKIEVFDNSHISGTSAVGAMIVSDLTGFNKDNYRKFNIKAAAGDDDYAMLAEVLTRRYGRMVEEDPDNQNDSWPDLILIDGGKGQATIAAQIFAKLKLDIPFYCIAKGVERNKGKERFCNDFCDYFTIEDVPTLNYLQRIRDEAHRFVITTHRKKRDKNTFKSQLSDIPGIGENRRKTLLKYFASIENMRELSAKDIAKAPGISLKLADEIKRYFGNV